MTTLHKSLSALAAAGIVLAGTSVSRADDTMQSAPQSPTGINPEPPRGADAPLPSGATDIPYGTNSDETLQPYGSAGQGATRGSTVTTPPSPPPPVATSTTTITSAEYYEGVGAEKPSWSPNKPLLGLGSALFVGTYGASVIVGAASGNDADKKLFIPVVGPWIDMGERSCGFGQCNATEDFNNALLVASGVAQAAGIGFVVASLFVPDSSSSRSIAKAPPKPEVHVLPTSFGRAGAGVGAVGTF